MILRPSLQFIMQPGTSLDVVLHEKSFPEPRLIIFSDENRVKEAQAFIIAEKEVLFEIDNFSVCDALISLIAAYYVFFVSYPKSCTASGLLLFIQEVLLGSQDVSTKKTSKYTALINSFVGLVHRNCFPTNYYPYNTSPWHNITLYARVLNYVPSSIICIQLCIIVLSCTIISILWHGHSILERLYHSYINFVHNHSILCTMHHTY